MGDDDSTDKDPVSGGRRAVDHQTADELDRITREIVRELRGAVFGYYGDEGSGLLHRMRVNEEVTSKILTELSNQRTAAKVGIGILVVFVPVLTTLGVALVTGGR